MQALAEKKVTMRDFQRVAQVVQQHCGINLHDGKLELVQARLAKILRTEKYDSAGDYLDHVLANPGSPEFTTLIDSLSTNLTSFFRESGHFTYFANTFLPALVARKKDKGERTIRGWSAASSTGEEPYTLAMVLLEGLETLNAEFDAKLLATDISTRVLQIAKQGIYEKQRVAPVPQNLRSKYFVPAPDGDLQVTRELRSLVRYGHLNLIKPWPFNGPMDFIFCRNVMIYFDKPTQQQLVNRFYDILAPGGLLFTGHCESLSGITHKFRHVQATIYHKS